MNIHRFCRIFGRMAAILFASSICASCGGDKPQSGCAFHENETMRADPAPTQNMSQTPAAYSANDYIKSDARSAADSKHKGTSMNDINAAQSDFDRVNVFGKGNPNAAYAQYFIGNSWLNPLTGAQAPIAMANVTFEPGARNHWHIHHASKGGGQMLICTAGEGWYQAFGEAPVSLKPGMVISIPAGVKHWHGAKAGSWFSHISVEVPGENGRNEWLEPVTDEEYAKLPPSDAPTAAARLTEPETVTAGRDALGDFAPKFAQLNDEVLFGQVWSRQDKLSKRDRSLITVAALMASGVLDSSLEHHIARAKNNGVAAEEMAEALTQLGFYAGWPKAWAAFRMAKKIYGE